MYSHVVAFERKAATTVVGVEYQLLQHKNYEHFPSSLEEKTPQNDRGNII
jgi:hypothetical protein